MIIPLLKLLRDFITAMFMWFVFKPWYWVTTAFRGRDHANKQSVRFIAWLERLSDRLDNA